MWSAAATCTSRGSSMEHRADRVPCNEVAPYGLRFSPTYIVLVGLASQEAEHHAARAVRGPPPGTSTCHGTAPAPRAPPLLRLTPTPKATCAAPRGDRTAPAPTRSVARRVPVWRDSRSAIARRGTMPSGTRGPAGRQWRRPTPTTRARSLEPVRALQAFAGPRARSPLRGCRAHGGRAPAAARGRLGRL